jgi:hypothetical protein
MILLTNQWINKVKEGINKKENMMEGFNAWKGMGE